MLVGHGVACASMAMVRYPAVFACRSMSPKGSIAALRAIGGTDRVGLLSFGKYWQHYITPANQAFWQLTATFLAR